MGDLISLETADFQWSQIQSVTATVLYTFLWLSKWQFSRWCKKNIIKNEFAFEWTDWVGFDIVSSSNNGITIRDYHLTIDFAKRLSMMARTEKWEEARLYFLNIEKAFREVVKPKSTLDMLKEAVLELEKVERQNIELSKTVRSQNHTNIVLLEMKASGTRTWIKAVKDNIGAEINSHIQRLYGHIYPGEYQKMHRRGHGEYLQATGIYYQWASIADIETKRAYLRWLQKQTPVEKILQHN